MYLTYIESWDGDWIQCFNSLSVSLSGIRSEKLVLQSVMGTWSGGGGENEDRKAVIDFCGFNESQSLIPRWALMDTTIPVFFPSVLKAVNGFQHCKSLTIHHAFRYPCKINLIINNSSIKVVLFNYYIYFLTEVKLGCVMHVYQMYLQLMYLGTISCKLVTLDNKAPK